MLYGAFHEPNSTFKGPECNTFFKLKRATINVNIDPASAT